MSGQTAYSRPDSYGDDYKYHHHLLSYYEHYYSGLSTTTCSSSSPSIASLFISKFPSRLKYIVLVAALLLLSMPSLCFAGETQNTHIEDYCHQVGPCQCRMLNHSGEINLKKVAFFNGKPRFVISLNDTYSVAYNPCVGFSLDPSRSSQYQPGGASHECDDAAVCVFRVGDKDSSYSNLGKSNSAMFQFDPDSNKFFIAYTSPDSKFKTDVYLQCRRSVDQLSVIKSGKSNQSLSLLLQSVCACPGACNTNTTTTTTTATSSFSPGSYILILFFTLFFLYFFLGILYQRIVYSAEGSELLPNREGWHSFFSLVKDGYLFFISPCLGNTVEYRYYQRL